MVSLVLAMLMTQIAAPVPPSSVKNSAAKAHPNHRSDAHHAAAHRDQRRMQTTCRDISDCAAGETCVDFSSGSSVRRRASKSPGRRLFGAPPSSGSSNSLCVQPQCATSDNDQTFSLMSTSCSSTIQGFTTGELADYSASVVCACLTEISSSIDIPTCRPTVDSTMGWRATWDYCQSPDNPSDNP